jgi:transcriptional regulator with XRE-family HTH domain
MKKTFMGVRLRKLRAERGMSQTAMANALGLSPSYLNQLEQNQRPLTVAVLLKIDRALGINIQEFSEDEEARLIAGMREALADATEPVSLPELKEVASQMPALGRALIALHRRSLEVQEHLETIAVRMGDVLAYQSLLPDQWMNWYAPGGVVDSRGATLHAIQWPRYLFIISLSLPALGLYLMAYADYFRGRPDRAPEYLDFARGLGHRLAVRGLAISFVLLLAWQFVHPASTGLSWHPVGWLLGTSLLAMAWWVRREGLRVHGYLPMLASLGVLGILAVWRELIRIRYMLPFGYDISDYTVHADWPSMVLFFSTFIGVGGLVGGFFLTTIYRAGRVQGLYTAERSVARLGTAAVVVLGVWITVFFAYGITIWMRNAFTL